MGSIYIFIFKNLFAGSLGEELGWRGFVQNHLQKRHSPLKASIIVGFGGDVAFTNMVYNRIQRA